MFRKLVGSLHLSSLFAEFAKKHVQPTLYSYSELRSATREFHPDLKLGQGAFGVVYKVCYIFAPEFEVANGYNLIRINLRVSL